MLILHLRYTTSILASTYANQILRASLFASIIGLPIFLRSFRA